MYVSDLRDSYKKFRLNQNGFDWLQFEIVTAQAKVKSQLIQIRLELELGNALESITHPSYHHRNSKQTAYMSAIS